MFITLAAPSSGFALVYFLIYVVAIGSVLIWQEDFNSEITKQTLSQYPSWTISLGLAFFILQKRELKRFTSEQKLFLREQETKHVFNSLSNAIIVVEQIKD